MGDFGEPGNTASAVRIAMAMVRPDTVECICEAEKKPGTPHAEGCPRKEAWRRWGEIVDVHTGRPVRA